MPDVTLTFEEIEQYQVLLKSGKSEITLKGKDVEQYPRIQEVDSLTPLLMDTKVLKSIIAETSFAASTQESRPILTGVHFVLSNHKDLKAVATDSHRMSQRQLVLEHSADNFDVVIPSVRRSWYIATIRCPASLLQDVLRKTEPARLRKCKGK